MQLSSFRYLVVDDMLTIRKAVTQVLSALGANSVSGASSGEQALKLLMQAAESGVPVHIVICDWHIPDVEGIEIVKRCRNHPLLKNVGFLMLTSESDANNVVDAMLSGVDNYLLKPVDPEALKEKLTAVIKKRFPGQKSG